MTADMIDQVQTIAERQEAEPGLVFQDWYGNIIADDGGEDDADEDNDSNYDPADDSIHDLDKDL